MNTQSEEPLVYRIPVVNQLFGACVYVCGWGGWVGVVSPAPLLLLLLSPRIYKNTSIKGHLSFSTLGLHFMEQKPLPSFKWCDGLDLVLFYKKQKQTKPKAWEQGHKWEREPMETRYSIHVPMECGSKVNPQERGLRISLVKKK